MSDPEQHRTVRWLYAECQRAIRDERWDEALDGFEKLVPLLKEAGDRIGMGRIRLQMAQAAEAAGRFERARRHCRETEEAARDAGDRRLQAAALHRLGHITRMDDPPAARELFQRCLAIGSGDPEADALAMAMIGQIDFTEGDRKGGLQQMLEGLLRLPASSPNREHLIEHIMYFGGKIERAFYVDLVRDHVPDDRLCERLLSARSGDE